MLLDRWSPRAMSGAGISHDELMRLFEAARWVPSSPNAQQWGALYAHRETDHWQTFFGLLGEGNKVWAKNAAVLLVFISRTIFNTMANHPLRTPTILAQAEKFSDSGFPAKSRRPRHAGLCYEGTRRDLRIPEEFEVEGMAAVGRPGSKEIVPEKLQERESLNDRREVSESIFEGPFRHG
jgi:Nitroreductase family